jgi:hypothetical protein
MTAFSYVLTNQDGLGATITAFNPDAEQPLVTANSAHPHFDEIVAGIQAGDPAVWDLFNVAEGMIAKFSKVTDRVSWNGSEVLFDGDPIHSVLADQLSRAIREGKTANYLALARFWERLQANPNDHSREQAYRFLAASAFQITADGLVVGFKGVTDNGDGTYSSTATSQVAGRPSAYVNGQPLPAMSKVKQRIGDEVSMPRSEVVHDPAKSCDRGLHVATYNYAKSYGTVMEVHVDPADIVSVPNGEDEKVRACRYKVAGLARDLDSYGQSTVLQSESAVAAAGWQGDVGYKV